MSSLKIARIKWFLLEACLTAASTLATGWLIWFIITR